MNNIELNHIYNYLKKEEVICLPTDTVWGLLGLATSSQAVQKIYRLKQRKYHKPLAVLVKDLTMAEKLVELNQLARALISSEKIAITIIAKQKLQTNLARHINLKTQNIALRIPKANFLIELIVKLNLPLAATSANISGKKINYDQIKRNFAPYIYTYSGSKPKTSTEPSFIIDFTTYKPKIIRASENQKILLKNEFKLF